jgi:hypothetical protein
MSKKKPVFSVEKSLADIAKTVHDLREEGESTDRMVVVATRGIAALTARVEALEKSWAALLFDVEQLKKPARTWLQWFNGE